jgi:hypothetical protein
MDLVVTTQQDLATMINEAVIVAFKAIDKAKGNNPFPHLPEMLTRTQVCREIFDISYMTLDAWVRQERLIKYRVANMVRFKKSEVLQVFDSCQKYSRA